MRMTEQDGEYFCVLFSVSGQCFSANPVRRHVCMCCERPVQKSIIERMCFKL